MSVTNIIGLKLKILMHCSHYLISDLSYGTGTVPTTVYDTGTQSDHRRAPHSHRDWNRSLVVISLLLIRRGLVIVFVNFHVNITSQSLDDYLNTLFTLSN